MAQAVARHGYRSGGRRSEGPGGRVLGGSLALMLALACGGCSLSFPIASLVEKGDPDAPNSIAVRPVSPLSAELGEEDWRRARGALAVALDPHGNGSSVNWDNPDSGLKGTFAPVGAPFVKQDVVCRAFLASVVSPDAGQWLQGSACRGSGGEWAVRDVKPWKKPA